MLPQQSRHNQPHAGSPCHSLDLGIGPVHHPDARAQENWHSSQDWPLASPLTQGLYTNSMSWKHGVAP